MHLALVHEEVNSDGAVGACFVDMAVRTEAGMEVYLVLHTQEVQSREGERLQEEDGLLKQLMVHFEKDDATLEIFALVSRTRLRLQELLDQSLLVVQEE